MKGFKSLEKKYGVHVVSEGHFFSPHKGKMVESFAIYCKDGCCWEKGLSPAGVKAECEEWSDALLKIKNA